MTFYFSVVFSKFYYKNLTAGYKMVGNAVPPNLAYILVQKIYEDLSALGYGKDEPFAVKNHSV